MTDFGLMFYNARWYDPTLGRFNQPDTVISSNVQGLDRYAYVYSNPIKFSDPTGHCASDDDPCIKKLQEIQKKFSLTINDEDELWTLDALESIEKGMKTLFDAMGKDDFVAEFAEVTFFATTKKENYMWTTGRNDIWIPQVLMDDDLYLQHETVHELAHIWDNNCDDCLSKGMMTATGGSGSEEIRFLFWEIGLTEYLPNGILPTDYANKSRREDWAESVTAYLFPAYADYNPWSQERQDYIADALSQ
jgi:RHS repeat-associated protein